MNKIEVICGLIAFHIGEIYGYTSQQGGRLFNDIIPIESQKNIANSSAGYDAEFNLHTEDAFFEFPPDFICWGCHRNDEGVGTRLATIADIELDPRRLSLLSGPDFLMIPNVLQEVTGSARRYPIITKVSGSLRMRINANHSSKSVAVGDCEEAYEWLVQELTSKSIIRRFSSGEIFILNNKTSAHGRLAYEPAENRNSRWLTRIVVRRDIEAMHRYMLPNSKYKIAPTAAL